MTGTEQLDEVVANLRAVQDQIEAEERDLLAALALVRDRKRVIRSMVRAAGPKRPSARKKRASGQKTGPRPETMAKARKALKRVTGLEAIEGVPGSFTARDFARATGLADVSAAGALYALREEGKVRMAGRRGRSEVFAVMSS